MTLRGTSGLCLLVLAGNFIIARSPRYARDDNIFKLVCNKIYFPFMCINYSHLMKIELCILYSTT